MCDHYALTVDVEPTYWNTRDGGVDVSITWADGADDFDLYVYDSAGMLVASSAQGGTTSELAVVSKPSGAYEVRVVPFLVTDSGYTGEVQFRAGPGGGAPPLGGPAEYHGTVFDDEEVGLPEEEPENVAIDSPQPSLVLKSGAVGRDAAEPTRLDRCARDRNAIGFDEDDMMDNASRDMKGLYVKQISGPGFG